MALRTLSLCAGIGGIDLGLARWCRTVCYVEREAFAASVLVARMEEAALDPAPIWDDLSTFDGRAWRGAVDLIAAGYPCQPFSVAGKREGENDPRHLWPHVARIAREVGPRFLFLENVAGHLRLGFDQVLGDLAEMGYDAEWGLFRASDVGAPHKRERLFVLVVGDAECARWEAPGGGSALDAGCQPEPRCRELGHPRSSGLEERRPEPVAGSRPASWPPGPAGDWSGIPWWLHPAIEPDVRRDPDGLPPGLDPALFRVDRLRALGNAVVPQCAELAFETLAARAGLLNTEANERHRSPTEGNPQGNPESPPA